MCMKFVVSFGDLDLEVELFQLIFEKFDLGFAASNSKLCKFSLLISDFQLLLVNGKLTFSLDSILARDVLQNHDMTSIGVFSLNQEIRVWAVKFLDLNISSICFNLSRRILSKKDRRDADFSSFVSLNIKDRVLLGYYILNINCRCCINRCNSIFSEFLRGNLYFTSIVGFKLNNRVFVCNNLLDHNN